MFRREEDSLAVSASGSRPFDASATDFKMVAEAQRIKLAGLYDPMLAVATSNVRPLPHQIRAVYGELLPRTPLRRTTKCALRWVRRFQLRPEQ